MVEEIKDSVFIFINHKMMEQILPILEERRKEMKTKPKFFDPRINFQGVLELMELVFMIGEWR